MFEEMLFIRFLSFVVSVIKEAVNCLDHDNLLVWTGCWIRIIILITELYLV